jgi:hypothetical protein
MHGVGPAWSRPEAVKHFLITFPKRASNVENRLCSIELSLPKWLWGFTSSAAEDLSNVGPGLPLWRYYFFRSVGIW